MVIRLNVGYPDKSKIPISNTNPPSKHTNFVPFFVCLHCFFQGSLLPTYPATLYTHIIHSGLTMSVLRSAITRSVRAPMPHKLLPMMRGIHISAPRFGSDEEKARASYEKHRKEVEPGVASIDESVTFTQPKVCFSGWRELLMVIDLGSC